MKNKTLVYNQIENKFEKEKNIKKIKYRGYNPFKMLGSWGGLILGFFFLQGFIAEFISVNFYNFSFHKEAAKQTILMLLGLAFGGPLADSNYIDLIGKISQISLILSFILGFLIGWAIHSLCRYFKMGDKVKILIKNNTKKLLLIGAGALILIFVVWGFFILNESMKPHEGGLPYVTHNGSKIYITPIDNARNVTWGCQRIVMGASSSTNGFENTKAIVEGCSTEGIAARVCSDLNFAGYDDWYLPAKEQLVMINNQKNNILKGDYTRVWHNLEGFYWSSTEDIEIPDGYAFFGGWWGSDYLNIQLKDANFGPGSLMHARCIREG